MAVLTRTIMLAPTHLQNFGVVREPKTLVLDRPFNDPDHFVRDPDHGADWPGIKVKEPATEKERQRYLLAWSSLPWAPAWDACEDVGWWKGKWTALYEPYVSPKPTPPSRRYRRKLAPKPAKPPEIPLRRWGGWYDEVVMDLSDIELVQETWCVESGTNRSSRRR
jgi:hypothetical protein